MPVQLWRHKSLVFVLSTDVSISLRSDVCYVIVWVLQNFVSNQNLIKNKVFWIKISHSPWCNLCWLDFDVACTWWHFMKSIFVFFFFKLERRCLLWSLTKVKEKNLDGFKNKTKKKWFWKARKWPLKAWQWKKVSHLSSFKSV